MYPSIPPTDRSFSEWSDHLSYIQEKRNEILPETRKVEIEFTDNQPKFVALIGDAHIGAECDYGKLKDEVLGISQTDGAHVLLLGDIVDGYFWGGGATQDAHISLSEEVHMARALLDTLNGKILAGWRGDHDSDWAEKGGVSMYQDFMRRYRAHILHGIAYVDIKMAGGTFKMAGAHRHAGNSIYSKTAAAQRLFRESAPDCDIVFTGHTHQKGLTEQTVTSSKGPRRVLYATVGPYKKTDSWLRKQGYGRQEGDDLGGIGLVLYPDGKVDAHYDLLDGLEKFTKL